jgi:hypothetical protein
MPRIVSFGCSYTAGDCMPDRAINSKKLVSDYAYPAIISKLLNIPCNNQARSGAGNLEILWNILHFKFQPDDIVLVMWSHFSRDCILNNKEKHSRIDLHTKSKLTRTWLATHTDYDHNMRNWIYIHHAGCYFSKLNLQQHHMLGGDYWDFETKPAFLNIDNLLSDIKFDVVDFASDGSHPGVDSHNLLAEKIAAVIKLN